MQDTVNVQVIIQARMSSTRLPGKILSPFAGGHSVLSWIIERARSSKYVDRVVVATTENSLDARTEEECARRNCACVRGSEENVLQRFSDVVQAYPTKIIIHWTADNPLVDIAEMDRLIEMIQHEGVDYANNHKDGLPLGAGIEVFTSKAFERVVAEADTEYDREHVTPYFYNNPELFAVRFVAPKTVHPFAPNVRWTLDSPEDLEFLQVLAQKLPLTDPADQPTTYELLSFLEQNPDISALNSHIAQKTVPYIKCAE